jgi:YteA family regulatory protein
LSIPGRIRRPRAGHVAPRGAISLDAARREHFRQKLERQREELLRLRAHERRDQLGQSQSEATGETAVYDNHPADVGTETWQRSQLLAQRAEQGDRLVLVERALAKLARDEYGRCERCGRPIEPERLEAMPEARYCIACRRAVEAEGARDPQRRPVEEELLSPPFGRTFNDGRDTTAFDGEDAWQAVAAWGTSETPSDVPEAHRYPDVYVDAGERRGAVEDVEELLGEDGEPLDPKNRRG